VGEGSCTNETIKGKARAQRIERFEQYSINKLSQIAGIGTKLVLVGILAYGGWRVLDYALTPNPQTTIKQYLENVRSGEYSYEQLKKMVVDGAEVTPEHAGAYLDGVLLGPKTAERAKRGQKILTLNPHTLTAIEQYVNTLRSKGYGYERFRKMIAHGADVPLDVVSFVHDPSPTCPQISALLLLMGFPRPSQLTVRTWLSADCLVFVL